jgi:hypothetical protein
MLPVPRPSRVPRPARVRPLATLAAAVLVASAVTVTLTAPAQACPDWRQNGQTVTYGPGQLDRAQSFTFQAGGPYSLSQCPTPGTGWAAAAPHLTMTLQGQGGGRNLVFRVDAPCDTVLLVNDASAGWHFNDDSQGLNPGLTLPAAADGVYDVWIGTFGQTGCTARLDVSTSGGLVPPPPTTQPQLLAEIANILAVQNGPSQTSEFTLDRPVTVTRLQTYHWNFGSGRSPGTIGLIGPDGAMLGPWPARGEPGQGGVPNANWVVEPQIRLAPGRYRVIDSDPGSWSQNAASNGAGFFWLHGIPVSDSGPVAPPQGTCPDPGQNGQMLTYDAQGLWTAQRFNVVAGGSLDLRACGSVPGHGWIIQRPDFTLNLTANPRNYDLEFRVEASCDPVLLVNDWRGQWHFNDDADGLNSRLRITGAQAGSYDIWVGTYGAATCQATLIAETFASAPPPPPPPPPACPDAGQIGAVQAQPFAALARGLTLPLRAGGAARLADCAAPGTGYADARPQITLDLRDVPRGGTLGIRATASCDTVLLVNDPAGRWSFNDDRDGVNPGLQLEGAMAGRYAIWLGTYGPTPCDAQLTFQGIGAEPTKPGRPQPPTPEPQALPDPGNLMGYRDRVGQTLAFVVTGASTGTIWGDGVYTDDSSLARAAVHAGVLRVGQTGVVRVTVMPGQPSYAAATRNGVSSQGYGSWSGSYSFAQGGGAVIPPTPAPTPAPAIAGTWSLVGNGYRGQLVLTRGVSGWSGHVRYDVHSRDEPLEAISFDPASGRIEFTRPIPGATQIYRGTVSGNRIEGQFNQNGGGYIYNWTATR